MTQLKNPIVSVLHDGGATYGGSQRLFENDTMRRAGCGVVAAADLLLYLALYHACPTALTGKPESNEISLENYIRLCEKLRRRYLPVIPRFGKTGVDLAIGLNAIFSHYRLPYRARWCAGQEKLFDRAEAMLSADIPVIISVGQNFPFAWGKEYLSLYTRRSDGSFVRSCGVKAHYMTLTGMDELWLRLSSWGREYYIRRSEYLSYSRLHSLSLTCNILLVEKIHS